MFFKKGQVFWADLLDSGKHIQCGKRPVVILGNNAANIHSEVVTVLPITSRVTKADKVPTHVVLKNALARESVILPEQIRTIPKANIFGNEIYKLSESEFKKVSDAVIYQLGLA